MQIRENGRRYAERLEFIAHYLYLLQLGLLGEGKLSKLIIIGIENVQRRVAR